MSVEVAVAGSGRCYYYYREATAQAHICSYSSSSDSSTVVCWADTGRPGAQCLQAAERPGRLIIKDGAPTLLANTATRVSSQVAVSVSYTHLTLPTNREV
eukprot:5564186-Heterocapsa_arctica.AAC.1